MWGWRIIKTGREQNDSRPTKKIIVFILWWAFQHISPNYAVICWENKMSWSNDKKLMWLNTWSRTLIEVWHLCGYTAGNATLPRW